ncbi:cysteine desulfurase [Candidatus Woesearchaeota archaeon]|nr:cysteine desulfurase [Candidatus Woesearchaeota archaeon]
MSKTKLALKTFDVESIRKDFPILKRRIFGKPLVYLDNSATAQKPQVVIDAMTDYYTNYNANVHRGIHKLSEEATHAYEEAHEKVAKFINGSFEEIIFTKGTTESLNLVAYSLGKALKPGDEVVITEMEHHSNIVPWQQVCKEKGAALKFIGIAEDGKLDWNSINSQITKKTKIVSLTHVSNVLGTINPIKEIGKVAHENNAIFIVDAAQSVPRMRVDVKDLDADFLAFSGHKMYGPTGIGVLYGKKNILQDMSPFLYGGDMIKEVKFHESRWNDLPWKFEAGTPNIEQGIGLGVAIDYINSIGIENIEEHERELTKHAMKVLEEVPLVTIYGPDAESRSSVVAFNFDNVHAHDVATILDREGIAVRAGHHCAMPLMSVLNIIASVRASFAIYNTKEEIDKLAASLATVRKVFKL